MNKITTNLTWILCLTIASIFETNGQSATEIIHEMFASSKQVNAASYTLKKIERIDGKMVEEVNIVKLNVVPFKLYFKQISPVSGMEILYPGEDNKDKALINPNSFPWININLNPQGQLMRKNQHHTLYETGFEYITATSEHLVNTYESNIKNMLKILANTSWEGKDCWHMELNVPDFRYQAYSVRNKESVVDIAKKLRISEYLILEKNPGLKYYDKLEIGDSILVPNAYAAKIELFIDQTSYLPLVIKIYDDNGLFEHYEYSDLRINPEWHNTEFDYTYNQYDF